MSLSTTRLLGGELVSRARPKFEWARLGRGARVHRVTDAIVRWNFNGGTRERPNVTYVFLCGMQRGDVEAVAKPHWSNECGRCAGTRARAEERARELEGN